MLALSTRALYLAPVDCMGDCMLQISGVGSARCCLAGEDVERPQRKARSKPGPVPFSPQAVLRVAWALEAAVKLQGGGAALGLILRDERAGAAARRLRTRIRLLQAACRGGDVGDL